MLTNNTYEKPKINRNPRVWILYQRNNNKNKKQQRQNVFKRQTTKANDGDF